ncbi:MAG: glycerol-3-phosphate dehydrogenase/oxidase [candidate division KSB1 bacterium]|nr:glycerol-3-phosphate dehydrogenase/oxidase [candidate division KSB1 bacterium]
MKRNPEQFKNTEFDVLIIGAGIYGAFAAWDAAMRGLKTALIDKGDFGSATSSNSLKIIHGGLRYLQHLDFIRMRESILERRHMMSMAPHLAHPLPCVMGTFGHMIKGPEAMRLALLLNDIISWDRNRLKDPQKHLPRGRVISRDKLLDIIPYIDRERLNGGAVWYDGIMSDSERLLLSIVRAAQEQGAVVANYMKAKEILIENNRTTGAVVSDQTGMDSFPVRAKTILSTAGPWVNKLARNMEKNEDLIEYSTAMNLIIDRKFSDYAIGASTKSTFSDKDAVISRGSRLLFIVPWNGKTMVGTAHKPFSGDPEAYKPSRDDVVEFLDEINSALPGAEITMDQVTRVLFGLLPMASVNETSGDVQLEKHYRIVDHAQEGGPEGAFSLVSVKYTTARDVAEKAIDVIAKQLNSTTPSETAKSRVWGGDIENYREFMRQSEAEPVPERLMQHLKAVFGSRYTDILELAGTDSELLNPLSSATAVTPAEILYGVRREMAVHLTDIVLRRTALGSSGCPKDSLLQKIADIAGDELGWSEQTRNTEINRVKEYAGFIK